MKNCSNNERNDEHESKVYIGHQLLIKHSVVILLCIKEDIIYIRILLTCI